MFMTSVLLPLLRFGLWSNGLMLSPVRALTGLDQFIGKLLQDPVVQNLSTLSCIISFLAVRGLDNFSRLETLVMETLNIFSIDIGDNISHHITQPFSRFSFYALAQYGS